MGEEGFSSDSSLLYHRGIPSAICNSRPWELPDRTTTPNHPLRPMHLRLPQLFADTRPERDRPRHRTPAGARQRRCPHLLRGRREAVAAVPQRDRRRVRLHRVRPRHGGDDVRRADLPRPRLRAAAAGHGAPLAPGRAWSRRTRSRPTPTSRPPKRYLSRFGQLLEHSPYCERDLHGPTEPLLVEGDEVEVYTLHRGPGPGGLAGSIVTATTHPFDVVGWDGCLYPYTFNVDDYEPITGRVHQPPPVHQVFEGQQLRGLQLRAAQGRLPPAGHPGAVLPLQRRLRRGDVLLRRRLRGAQGVRHRARARSRCTPAGTPTGRSPGAAEASIGKEYFDELAVMVDTFRPLELGEGGRASDDGVYATQLAPRPAP